MKMNKNNLSKHSPGWLKNSVKALFPDWFYRQVELVHGNRNEFSGQDNYPAPDSRYPFVLGVIKQFRHYHKHYIAACRDLGVSCKVLDISGSDWIKVIKKSQCDAYFVWPSSITEPLRAMFDERLKIMVDDLGEIVYPSFNELWLWDNKRRVRDWLITHDVSHPKTWIFYDYESAKDFLNNAEYPIVYKTNRGYAATGVKILHSKSAALKVVKKAITTGIRLPNSHPSDRQWGSAILQEYLPDCREVRMVRMGDSYFAYEKMKVADFHSGSGNCTYLEPTPDMLDFARDLCEKGKFTSMDIDIFITPDNRFLVNELQTVFGAVTSMIRFGETESAEHCLVNGEPGRMLRDAKTNQWRFEKGIFCQNALCNLRVKYVLDILESRLRLTDMALE